MNHETPPRIAGVPRASGPRVNTAACRGGGILTEHVQPRLRPPRRKLGCMSDYLQVSTTAESREAAVTLARSAVETRLAASAQVVGPVISVFWHSGELGEGEEWQVLLKTSGERYSDLEAHLIENHPWQNPEITAVPLVAGSASYFAWLRKTTAGDASA